MSSGVAFCSVVSMVLALLWADSRRKRCGSLRMQIICKDDNLRYLQKQHDALVDSVLGRSLLAEKILQGREGGYSSMVTDSQIREVASENRLCAEKLKEAVETSERFQRENRDLNRRVDCLLREVMSQYPTHDERLRYLDEIIAVVNRNGTVWNTKPRPVVEPELAPAMGGGCGVIPPESNCSTDTADRDLSLTPLVVSRFLDPLGIPAEVSANG